MSSIVINGQQHEVTEDGFGIRYIDGMTLDDFYDSLSDEDKMFCFNVGFMTAMTDPEAFNDYSESIESPVRVKGGKFTT